jgi:hypothetical protein
MHSKRKSPDPAPASAAVLGDPVLVEEDRDVKTELEERYTQVKDGSGDDSWFQTGLEVERIVQSGMCVCVCVCMCVCVCVLGIVEVNMLKAGIYVCECVCMSIAL